MDLSFAAGISNNVKTAGGPCRSTASGQTTNRPIKIKTPQMPQSGGRKIARWWRQRRRLQSRICISLLIRGGARRSISVQTGANICRTPLTKLSGIEMDSAAKVNWRGVCAGEWREMYGRRRHRHRQRAQGGSRKWSASIWTRGTLFQVNCRGFVLETKCLQKRSSITRVYSTKKRGN